MRRRSRYLNGAARWAAACLALTLFASISRAQTMDLPADSADREIESPDNTVWLGDTSSDPVRDEDPVRQAFAQSFRFEASADYPQAIEALLDAADQPQQAYAVHLRLGWLHYLQGDHEASGRYYREAMRVAPQATEPRAGYLLPLIAQKRFAEAETVARQALAIDPKDYYSNLRLAHALRMQGRYDEAARVSGAMLELKPTDVGFLTELGLADEGRQNSAAATESFQNVLLLDPDNVTALDRLGLESPLDDTVPYDDASAGGTCYPLTGSVTPYYAYLDYGAESIKNHGQVAGLYGYLAARNSIEGAIEWTNLRFNDSTNLDQQDYTLVYTQLWRPKWKFRVGGHFINNNDPFSDDTWSAFFGSRYAELNKWDIGIDAYYSRYQNHPINRDIVQLTPHVGIEVRPHDCLRVRLDTRLHWINTSEEVFNVGKQDFLSLEASLRFERDPWKFALIGWTGEQVFAVRRDGFTVYNLGELHTGGYGGEVTCRLFGSSYFTVRIADEIFTDITTLTGTHKLVATALLTRDF
jgi:tetratricopeptide (TPR) repeat protein